MLAGEGILVMFHWNAYFLCMSVSRPPLVGVYGILCWIRMVSACVLLKVSLYCGNRFCMYLVDLDAVHLVSCMVIMANVSCEWWIMYCMLDSVVLNDAVFHVMIWMWWLVFWLGCGGGGGGGVGGGCVYSVRGSNILNVSLKKFIGK